MIVIATASKMAASILTVVVLLLQCGNTFSAAVPLQFNKFMHSAVSTTQGAADSFNIPSSYESAVLARRIFNLTSIGVLATVFQPNHNKHASSSIQTNINNDKEDDVTSIPDDIKPATGAPADIVGAPIGLMDYFAPCPSDPSSPTILAVTVSTGMRNVLAGSNVSLTMRWIPPADHPPPRRGDLYTYSPANLPRFSLQGYVEALPAATAPSSKSELSSSDSNKTASLAECFLTHHPDARAWSPGNPVHESYWARIVVQGIWWIGGFGDRNYIGWIPVEEWEKVSPEEVREARLVGEKGWKPAVDSLAEWEL